MNDVTRPVTVADLEQAAAQLARRLAETRTRLVLAESCTGGLVAAMLTAIPGISQWFCGSAVVYRDQTKIDWIDVSSALIDHLTAVHREVTEAMAEGVLERTEEADLAVSVTGHLGPAAPAHLDGVVWLAHARRRNGEMEGPKSVKHNLTSQSRVDRQREAALLVMRLTAKGLGAERA